MNCEIEKSQIYVATCLCYKANKEIPINALLPLSLTILEEYKL
jgi:hypothetical protein